ncbi:MAG: hypothetical protein V4581_16715 [Bacteroidota bacterium]
MNITIANQYLKEKQVLSAEESSLQISFSDGRPPHDLAELLTGFARHTVNLMGSTVTGEFKSIRRILSDGSTVLIHAHNIPFYEAMCGLNYQEKFELFMGDEVELERVLEGNKAANVEKLKGLFKKAWYFKEDDVRYTFADKLLNFDMFGLAMTKTQLLAKLKNDNLPRKNIINLLAWFESQEELKTKD